jgi:integrase
MTRFIIPHRKRPEQVQRIIHTDILKHWRTRDARTIKPHDVLDLLDGIVDRGSPTMANRTAAIIDQMFRFGIQRRHVEASPVQLLFAPGGPEKPRDRALSDDELAALLGSLDTVMANAPRTASAIQIALLTACRRSEIALAKWSDIELDGKAPLWRVPPENSKTGVEYRVPLTHAAVAQFRRLKKRAGRSPHVMPAARGSGPVNPLLITRSVARHLDTLAEHGIKAFTLHDIRRTVRTGLSVLKIQPHIAERCLNHKQRGVEGAYDVHAYLDEKRDALNKWAAHLEALRP